MTISPELFIYFVFITSAMVLIIWIFNRRQDRKMRELFANQRDDKALDVMTQWFQDMRGGLDRNASALQQQLHTTHRTIGERLDRATEVISEVSKELGQVEEIGRQIKEFQDFLRSPKLRGNIGEQVLRDLLEQILPRDNFKLQHRFSRGQIVDAVILTDKGLIPIDAKFPLENFRAKHRATSEEAQRQYGRLFMRDIKKHIDAVGEKYIVPGEGTLDFALLYVPSEAIYYEIITGEEAMQHYAHEKRVLLVSPNSFYYFLQIILMGLEGQRIEETARAILGTLASMKKDTAQVAEGLRVLNSHITNAKNAMERVNSDFGALEGKIENARMPAGRRETQLPESEAHKKTASK